MSSVPGSISPINSLGIVPWRRIPRQKGSTAPQPLQCEAMKTAVCALFLLLSAAPGWAAVFDETIPPGANYDKAEFRLWLPEGQGSVRALAILVPGSNGDGRGQVDDPVW